MNNPSVLAQEFMKTGRLSSCAIIDTHTHMGPFYGLHLPNADLHSMIASMDRNNVECILSVPQSALFVPDQGNWEIENAMKLYPKRIRGYFAVNPNYPVSLAEIKTALKENPGYVGFKILPDYHKTRLDSKKYDMVLNFAADRGLLVLSHTWGQAMYDGNVYSNIDMIQKVVTKYPNMKFIMGHSVQGQCDEAIELAKENKNAYLELTDTYRINGMLEKMCARAGSHKVLFGTDLPWYSPAYCLGCILFAQISDDEKKNIIRRNIEGILMDNEQDYGFSNGSSNEEIK